ncbi:MAG: hypothetical protein IJL32_08645 [Oscillospiraceae bacterium]|nr:hypothetical protein [Oscillospiraceae bacterium]
MLTPFLQVGFGLFLLDNHTKMHYDKHEERTRRGDAQNPEKIFVIFPGFVRLIYERRKNAGKGGQPDGGY